MFGTMGISELIIILVIVLIIFGAGKLPQIGEGVGKALRGFKKEVNDIPHAGCGTARSESTGTHAGPINGPGCTGADDDAGTDSRRSEAHGALHAWAGTDSRDHRRLDVQHGGSAPTGSANDITAASSVSAQSTGQGQQPPTMEERAAAPTPVMRAQYPPLPAGAQAKPVAKRPSAIVNKDAVARVQAQQAAMKTKAAQPAGISPGDMQSLGEGLGDALRTFKQAVADVRNSVDPEMRTIQAEMDSAQKEFQQSIEAAKELPALHEEPPKQA